MKFTEEQQRYLDAIIEARLLKQRRAHVRELHEQRARFEREIERLRFETHETRSYRSLLGRVRERVRAWLRSHTCRTTTHERGMER